MRRTTILQASASIMTVTVELLVAGLVWRLEVWGQCGHKPCVAGAMGMLETIGQVTCQRGSKNSCGQNPSPDKLKKASKICLNAHIATLGFWLCGVAFL